MSSTSPARGYTVECEAPCPGIQQPKAGDRKRLDFHAQRNGVQFALEVKWAKHARIDVKNDYEKLSAFRTYANGLAYLCVFGKKSAIQTLNLRPAQCFEERGKPVIAEFGVTRFGCRIFVALNNVQP